MIFKGSEAAWKKWIAKWLKDRGLCEEFACCHELDSCGTRIRCSCSSYPFQAECGCDDICRSATCIDCMYKITCKKAVV